MTHPRASVTTRLPRQHSGPAHQDEGRCHVPV